MADQADLRAALAEAVEESEFPTTDGEAAKSWDDWDKDDSTESASAADGDEPSKEETPDEPEVPEASDEVQDDLPDEYWGVPLDGIPEDRAREILAKFEQQDSTIQKLQARLAKEPEPVEPTADDDVVALEDITDEQLLTAAGYDPEDFEVQQMARFILPGLRRELALEEKVDALVQKDTVNTVTTQWNTQLNELEESHGKLPFSREQVLRYAIEEGIATPFEAYFRLTAGPRKEVESAVAIARREAAKKAEAGGVKPRSSSGDSPVIKEGTSLKDAVAIAMKESEKETGLSFRNIFGNKKFKAEE